MKARRHSPFARARLAEISKMRALVRAYQEWERALLTPAQTLSPKVPSFARNGLPLSVESKLVAKTEARLASRSDAEAVARSRRELLTRARDPDLWAKEQSAQHLAGIHSELARLRLTLAARGLNDPQLQEDLDALMGDAAAIADDWDIALADLR